jgi:spermidine synthase
MLEKVVLCELDEDVIRVSRDYLPGVSGGALDGTNAKVSIFGSTYTR